jgi:hypothetical protein
MKVRLDLYLWAVEEASYTFYVSPSGSEQELSSDSSLRHFYALEDPPINPHRWYDLVRAADCRGFRRWRRLGDLT